MLTPAGGERQQNLLVARLHQVHQQTRAPSSHEQTTQFGVDGGAITDGLAQGKPNET
jgi:hypothetical protein